MCTLFRGHPRLSWVRGWKKQLRIDRREVKRTARLPYFGDADVRLFWLQVVGKLQFAILAKSTHHHYGPAWIAYIVFRDRCPETIPVETRGAASGVEFWEVRATVRRHCHPRQL